MDTQIPEPIVNYFRDQLVHKKKPVQRAIQNTYNYWKAMYEFLEKELTEDQAKRLLREAASKIRGGLS